VNGEESRGLDSGTRRPAEALFLGRINSNIVCVMALKAFISLAVLVAVLVGLLMPVPGHRKTEATQSKIETIDVN
jgi:hypothetical protein